MNVLAVLSPTPDVVLAAVHEYVRRSEDNPTSRDIATRYGWPITDVSDKLSQLATRGRVERLPGGAYRTRGTLTIVPPMQAADRKEPVEAPPTTTQEARPEPPEEPRQYTAVKWPPDEEFMATADREYARPNKGAIYRLASLFECTPGAVQKRINLVYQRYGRDRPTRCGLAPVRVGVAIYRKTNTHYGPDGEFAAAAEQAYRESYDPLQVLMDRYGVANKKAVGKHVATVFERLGRTRPYITSGGPKARGADGL